jgi:hypothetical protein
MILHPKARDAIRRFPKDVRIRLGRGLFRLEMGEQMGMPNSRPIPDVATGVSELRVKGEDGAYRAFDFRLRRVGSWPFTRSSRKPSEPLLLRIVAPSVVHSQKLVVFHFLPTVECGCPCVKLRQR